jgi:hypothetical protein
MIIRRRTATEGFYLEIKVDGHSSLDDYVFARPPVGAMVVKCTGLATLILQDFGGL